MTVCLGYAGVGLQDGPWSSEGKSAPWALGLVVVVKRSAVVVADGDGSRNVDGKDARVGSGVRYVRERSTAGLYGFLAGAQMGGGAFSADAQHDRLAAAEGR
jgi:hypothetical protein